MNKHNKKWSIITSIILVSVLASSIGIGAIIGATTKENDYIKFYVGEEEYTPEYLIIGDKSTSDEQKALMVQAQFLTYAIFGTIDINSISNNENKNAEYLLAKDQTWNTTYQVERSATTEIEKTILDSFVKMKFFNDTQDSSVISYLYTRMETATNPQDLLMIVETIISFSSEQTPAIDPMQITGMDVINFINNEEDTTQKSSIFGDNLFKTLIDDYSYKVEILMDIYTYIYLWQEPVESNTYDYMLTKELAYSKPSITWSMTYDAEKFDSNPDEVFSNFMIQVMTYSDVTKYEDENEWNTIYEAMYKKDFLSDPNTYRNELKIDATNQYKGFQGVTFGTTAGSGIDSSWNESQNIWDYEETESDPITETGDNENTNRTNIMVDTNIYVPEENDGKGGIVSGVIDDPEKPTFTPPSGEESIYLYNQLTPYIFKTSTMNDGTSEFGTAKFSLFANKEETEETYTPYNPESQEHGGEGVVYLFDDWFTEPNSLTGEIYVVEALLLHNSSLEISATKYWQEKGFYIELSGQYEEDLISFIPADMIKE